MKSSIKPGILTLSLIFVFVFLAANVSAQSVTITGSFSSETSSLENTTVYADQYPLHVTGTVGTVGGSLQQAGLPLSAEIKFTDASGSRVFNVGLTLSSNTYGQYGAYEYDFDLPIDPSTSNWPGESSFDAISLSVNNQDLDTVSNVTLSTSSNPNPAPSTPPATADTTPPTLTFTSPQDNSSFSNYPVQLSGTATDNEAVTDITITIKDASAGSTGNILIQESFVPISDNWSLDLDPYHLGYRPGYGTFNFEAVAYDAAGNQSSTETVSNITFSQPSGSQTTAANTPPTVTVSNLTDNQVIYSDELPYTITGTITDPDSSQISTIAVSLGNRYLNIYSGVDLQSGQFKWSHDLPNTALPAGQLSVNYEFHVYAMDDSGAQSQIVEIPFSIERRAAGSTRTVIDPSTYTPSQPSSPVLAPGCSTFGDATGDNVVDIEDIQAMIQQNIYLRQTVAACPDPNQDGVPNFFDLVDVMGLVGVTDYDIGSNMGCTYLGLNEFDVDTDGIVDEDDAAMLVQVLSGEVRHPREICDPYTVGSSQNKIDYADLVYVSENIFNKFRSYQCFTIGDATGDGVVNDQDIRELYEMIFENGPNPLCTDPNQDGLINVDDLASSIDAAYNNPRIQDPSPCNYVTANVDDDEDIDNGDVAFLLLILIGSIDPSPYCDPNNDGYFTTDDLVNVYNGFNNIPLEGHTSVAGPSATCTTNVIGDVTNDGFTNNADLTAITNIIHGRIVPSSNHCDPYPVNFPDNVFNLFDLILVSNQIYRTDCLILGDVDNSGTLEQKDLDDLVLAATGQANVPCPDPNLDGNPLHVLDVQYVYNLLLANSSVTPPSFTCTSGIEGDVDNSGHVSVTDLQALNRIIIGAESGSQYCDPFPEGNPDGQFNQGDVTYVLGLALGDQPASNPANSGPNPAGGTPNNGFAGNGGTGGAAPVAPLPLFVGGGLGAGLGIAPQGEILITVSDDLGNKLSDLTVAFYTADGTFLFSETTNSSGAVTGVLDYGTEFYVIVSDLQGRYGNFTSSLNILSSENMDLPITLQRVSFEEPTATCYDNVRNQGETGIDCGGPCRPCRISEPCEGCMLDSTCYSVGTRTDIDNEASYCGFDEEWLPQKESGESCQTNFECKNFKCENSLCASEGFDIIGSIIAFFEGIAAWFASLFS